MKTQEPPLPHTFQEAPAPNHFLHTHSQVTVLPSQDSACSRKWRP